jgi:putative ABC transport system substrate-binding protein
MFGSRLPLLARKFSGARKIVSLVLMFVSALHSGCSRRAKSGGPTIGVVSIIEHPLLDQARRGFVDALVAAGYREGENVRYDYRNAYGKVENANAIAATFLGNHVELIFSISTPATQAVKERVLDIPVVFAAATNPVAAGIVPSEAAPGGNVTGVSDRVPIDRLFATLRRLLPGAKRLGLPYNAGEANSVAQTVEMRRLASAYGFSLVETTAGGTNEVSQAVANLVNKVDIVYMMADNTMAAAVNIIADICLRNRIPFVSCEDGTVRSDKALAAFVVDHHEMGVLAGRMAVRILKDGALPQQIPVARLSDFASILNLRVARKLGFDLAPEAIAGATLIQ